MKHIQITTLLAIVFFGFVSLSLPYPIFSPLFLHPESGLHKTLNLSYEWRTLLLGFTLAAYPFAQFFGAPLLGSLSDRFGRKKLLIIAMLGTGVGYLLSGWAVTNHQVVLLIISRLLTGFFEGNMGIAQASISDMKVDKYWGLGAIAAVSSLGYLVGPLVGGLLCDSTLMSWFAYEVPFYIGAVMAGLLALMILLFFKETVSQKNNKPFFSGLNVFKKVKMVYDRKHLRYAFIMIMMLSMSIDCYYEFYPAFLVESWQMTPKQIGLYSVTLSFGLSIGSLWLPQLLRKHANPLNYRLPLLSIFILSLLWLLFASTILALNLHFLITGLFYATLNTIQSVLISENASEHEQGEIMGLQWGIRMLGDGFLCIVGSLLLWRGSVFPIGLAIVLATLTFVYTLIYSERSGRYLKTS